MLVYYLLAIVFVFLIIICMILFFVLFRTNRMNQEKNRNEMHAGLDPAIQNQIAQNFAQFQNLMYQGMYEQIQSLKEDTTKRMFEMEQQMHQALHQQVETTAKAYQMVLQEVVKVQQSQDSMQQISTQIHDLQHILSDKKVRGMYGEMQLYTLLRNSFGEQERFWKKQVKLSNAAIVDAVLYGSKEMPMIPIDAKFPLENYRRLLEESQSMQQKQQHMTMFSRDVKKHIHDIAEKYILKAETTPFAFLFLPAESLFVFIHEQLPQLVNYAYSQHVYFTSPSTLLAYVHTIQSFSLQYQQQENMHLIHEELKKLSVEFERFTKRYQNVSSDLKRSAQSMEQLMITAAKIQGRFQKIVEWKQEEETS